MGNIELEQNNGRVDPDELKARRHSYIHPHENNKEIISNRAADSYDRNRDEKNYSSEPRYDHGVLKQCPYEVRKFYPTNNVSKKNGGNKVY